MLLVRTNMVWIQIGYEPLIRLFGSEPLDATDHRKTTIKEKYPGEGPSGPSGIYWSN